MSEPATPSPSSGNTNPHRGVLIVITGLLGFGCFLFGIAALVLAKSDLAGMENGSVDPAGRSLTKLGMTLGLVGIALQAISVLYFLLFADGGLVADGASAPATGWLLLLGS